MIKGIIITNAYYSSEGFSAQTTRLKEELAALGVDADTMRGDGFDFAVDRGEIINNLCEYDFAIYLDKDQYIAQMMERSGIRLFNSAASIAVCDDKMLTHIALAGNSIPMPKTIPGLLSYSPADIVSERSVLKIEESFGYPIIIKDCKNSLGAGVYKADDRKKLMSVMEKLKNRPHIFQEYIDSTLGRDLRVIVVGGKAIGGMLRRAGKDFRANISAGGTGEPYELSPPEAELAERAANIIGLDYAGVDFLFGPTGELILSEVNSNALFIQFEKVTGINVARAYAEHIVITGGRKNEKSSGV